MIMAAGMGTRMRPLTNNTPKPLLRVAGTTLLDHVLQHVARAGISNVVVNVHYLAEQVEAHLAETTHGLQITVSDERSLLRDTGGGLVQALPMIDADPFYCVNADNWWTDGAENALVRLAEAWDDAAMDVLMLVTPHARAGNTQGTGDFDMDDAGRLSRDGDSRPRPYVWTGIQLLSKRLIIDPPSDVFSTNVFWNRAIGEGRCYGLVHDGLWFDVGYPAAIPATEVVLESA